MSSNVNDIASRRAAMVVSHDVNFDEIYKQRFRKYCMLLAKERELLQRLNKRPRSHTVEPINDLNADDQARLASLTAKHNEESGTSYKAIKRRVHTDGRRSISLKDSRSAHHSTLLLARKLSTSFEENLNDEITPPTSRDKKDQSPEHLCKNRVTHAQSCDNITSKNTYENVTPRSFHSNALQDPRKNPMLTSSQRSLSDDNVRSLNRAKTLRASNPAFEKRMAEARLKTEKRNEALRKLSDDFTKADELLRMYRSNESIDGFRNSNESVDKTTDAKTDL